MKLKVMNRLCLVSLMLLTVSNCAGTKVVNGNPYGFCPIPVRASQPVKDWLNKQTMPPEVVKYLYQIGTEQQDIDRYCK